MLCSRCGQSSLVVVHDCTAMRLSLLKAGGHVPLAFPHPALRLDCRMTNMYSLRRFLLCGKGCYRCPFCWSVCTSVHCWTQALPAGVRSRVATNHLAVTVTPFFYAAASTCWLRSTSVWLECTSAKHSAVCFEPMGTSPSPFSIRVPCSHSLCRMFTLRRGFDLRSIVQCVLNPLGPVSAALRFWTLTCLAEGDCGRCLHTVIGLCGPHPRPLLLAMLCSLRGLSCFAYCAACRMAILHGC